MNDPATVNHARKVMQRLLSISAAIAMSLILPDPAFARPGRVAAFIAQRDKCDHFRGEEPYDKARARFLAAQMKRYCTGTDRRLKALRARYANQPKALARLADYEDNIE